jgi:hypothetical protein
VQLTVARTNMTDVGKYSVVVTNALGKKTSAKAWLIIK